MADPDGAVEVHGTVAVNGRVTSGDPDALVAQIESTRENLARTIDSIADRVSPANNARRIRERAREQMARPQVQRAALAVGVAAAGFVVYRIWSRRRK
jgi:anti-sigma factor RsiW